MKRLLRNLNGLRHRLAHLAGVNTRRLRVETSRGCLWLVWRCDGCGLVHGRRRYRGEAY